MEVDKKGFVRDEERAAASPRSVAVSNSGYIDETMEEESLEMANYAVEMIMDILGYPYATACGLVSRGWNRQFSRIYRNQLLEMKCVSSGVGSYLELPAQTKSTISLSFSCDKRRFASTHGDHTVKVIDFTTGKVEATLQGHPRTPWTVKFHPHNPDLLASGCLGFQARIWNLSGGRGGAGENGKVSSPRCTAYAEFDRAIISLSFHPDGDILAVAAGTSIYLWQYASGAPPLREFQHPHPIRCLRFLPNGFLVVGAANGVRQPTVIATGPLLLGGQQQGQEQDGGSSQETVPNQQRHQRGTFQLILFEIDIEAARTGAGEALMARGPGRTPLTGTGKAIIAHPRSILRHALFYNDGGFDVSPCGTFLCSCAELWVPEVVETSAVTPRTKLSHHRRREKMARSRANSTSGSSSPLDSDASCEDDQDISRRRRRFALDDDFSRLRSNKDRQSTTPPRLPSLSSSSTAVRRRREMPQFAPASPFEQGRYQPHLVIVSLIDTIDSGSVLLEAAPLDDRSFSGGGFETAGSDIVTSVKLSPTGSFILLGHSRGGDISSGDGVPRIVSVVYRAGDMIKIETRKQIGDDVNIARFHPKPGSGLVYGTKQGRICKFVPLANVTEALDGNNDASGRMSL